MILFQARLPERVSLAKRNFAANMTFMKPRTLFVTIIAACATTFAFLNPNLLTAQSETQSPAVTALIQDLQTQQATLADNQKQIDAKIAGIAEALRIARIYVGRGGGGK